MTFDIGSLTGARVLILGDVMLDKYVWGEVHRISPEAPVPIVRVKDVSETLGGAGNVAANVVGLGAKATVIGLIGFDAPGLTLETLFKNKGIETYFGKEPDRPTITKTRIMAKGQQLLRLDEDPLISLKTTTERRLLDHYESVLKQHHIVILADYGKGFFQTFGFCQKIIRLCNHRNIPVIVDPKGGRWERYRGATCITPNTTDLAEVTTAEVSQDDACLVAEARRLCRGYHLDWVLVTRGPRGMCLVNEKGTTDFIEANARGIYDVSGAGDTVAATLATCLASGHSILTAARAANIAAGIVVGKLGTHPIDQAALATAIQLMEIDAYADYAPKVVTREAARTQIKAWQHNGETVVFTHGSFDLLHPGHITLLNHSKSLGSRLVIGLNTDAAVRRSKGPSRPLLAEQDRAGILSSLSSVDLVVLVDEDSPTSLIQTLEPNVLLKGADCALEEVVGRDIVEAAGGRVCLAPLLEGHSTTGLSLKISKATRP